MPLTEQQVQDLVDATRADPDTMIELYRPGQGHTWRLPQREVAFDDLNNILYRIAPTPKPPKLRPRTREEWDAYCLALSTGFGWVRGRMTDNLVRITEVLESNIDLGSNRLTYESMVEVFTDPDGKTLLMEQGDDD